MYKVLCEECGQYNYSASKAGKWICCYCGKELTDSIKGSASENDKKKAEKLA